MFSKSARAVLINGPIVFSLKSNLSPAARNSSGSDRVHPSDSPSRYFAIAFFRSFFALRQTCRAPVCAIQYSI